MLIQFEKKEEFTQRRKDAKKADKLSRHSIP
jgi:hypothetical protein